MGFNDWRYKLYFKSTVLNRHNAVITPLKEKNGILMFFFKRLYNFNNYVKNGKNKTSNSQRKSLSSMNRTAFIAVLTKDGIVSMTVLKTAEIQFQI